VLPPLPGPNGPNPIVKPEQLLPLTRQWLKNQRPGQGQALTKAQGRWPDYALAVSELAAAQRHPIQRLGANKPSDFSPEIQDFIKEPLLIKISPVEAQQLGSTESKPWPAYPKLLHELAKKYDLVIPGMSLPGPRELWASARAAALPDMPERELRAFVEGLSHEEKERLKLSPGDPALYDRARPEYFRRNPEREKHLREIDEKKREGKRK
jgi:hypothetical protein